MYKIELKIYFSLIYCINKKKLLPLRAKIQNDKNLSLTINK